MWRPIFKATIIAGGLDITGACIQAYISKNVTPDILLKYIASGVLGKEAFSGGFEVMLLGLSIHLFIVFACTSIYFLVYPKLELLQKNVLLSSLFVALTAWAITTRIIIPLSSIQPAPFNSAKALLAISILYFCIGLPITLLARSFYRRKSM